LYNESHNFLKVLGQGPILFEYEGDGMIAQLKKNDACIKHHFKDDPTFNFSEPDDGYEGVQIRHFVSHAEFYLSRDTFSFEIFMRLVPALGFRNSEITNFIKHSGHHHVHHTWNGLDDRLLYGSFKEIVNNPSNSLEFELQTENGFIKFYKNGHELVDQAITHILEVEPGFFSYSCGSNQPKYGEMILHCLKNPEQEKDILKGLAGKKEKN